MARVVSGRARSRKRAITKTIAGDIGGPPRPPADGAAAPEAAGPEQPRAGGIAFDSAESRVTNLEQSLSLRARVDEVAAEPSPPDPVGMLAGWGRGRGRGRDGGGGRPARGRGRRRRGQLFHCGRVHRPIGPPGAQGGGQARPPRGSAATKEAVAEQEAQRRREMEQLRSAAAAAIPPLGEGARRRRRRRRRTGPADRAPAQPLSRVLLSVNLAKIVSTTWPISRATCGD